VILSRLLQFTLPFHQRPLLTPGLEMHLPLSIRPETYNAFSSFPSDTARTALPDRIIHFAKVRPGLFYPLAFIATFELSILFYDLRQFGLGAAHLTKALAG
jgi:hypothetical protein